MHGFVGRRRQQQFASFFGTMCLALCACTDGKGVPLMFADGGEAGTSGTGTSSAGHSGMHAIDASVDIDDDEPVLTSECRQKTSMWPASYTADEDKLLDELNKLRANPTTLCPSPFALPDPFAADGPLQCAARLRAREESGYPKSGGSPGYTAAYYFAQRSQDPDVRDREKRAGSTRIDAEITFYNVASVASLLDALAAHRDEIGDFCGLATNPLLPFVGIGRHGNVWVLDLSSGLRSPTRPPTSGSGMGSSGPGNSGTAGR